MENYIESIKKQISDIEGKINEAHELAKMNDESLKTLALEEIDLLEKQKSQLEASLISIESSKSTKSSSSKMNNYTGAIILEIRAGAGGDEAGLFANDLLNMYLRFAEINKWNSSIISKNDGGIGNIKEVVAEITGRNLANSPYTYLKYESGVHRVQRVPVTESSGRIHTSTATVAILPVIENVDIEIRTEDLRIDTYRASGAGGQHVNKTESAIRITHLPTGVVVQCQDERSQHKNRERAMSLLNTKLFDMMQQQQKSNIDDLRSGQIGSGDRSEKIKTYNIPQDRLTDHRIKKSWYGLNTIFNGAIGEILLESAKYIDSGTTANDSSED